MILNRRFTLISLIALLVASLAGCTQEETPQLQEKENGVTLRLVIDTGAESSRADAPDYFEKPEGEFEKIYTLRVILAKPVSDDQYEIEANKLVRTTPSGQPIDDNLEFKVSTGNKIVYLIANEASLTVPASVKDKYTTVSSFLDGQYMAGKEFLSGILQDWLVSLPGEGKEQEVTQSMYSDNPNAKGLPLTEFFQFNVGATVVDQQYDETQTVQLFLTRAAAKATFNIKVAEGYKGSGVNVTGIRLNGVNVQQYVFPREAKYCIMNGDAVQAIDKEAIITPGLPGVITQVDRFITSFVTPQRHFQGMGASMVMNLPEADFVEIKAKADTILGPVYFTESLMPNTTAKFSVQVELDGNGNWLDAQPLGVGEVNGVKNNILLVNGAQAIARNTHLKITITFDDQNQITATVQLVPYVSVVLNPTFGFIEPNPNQSN